MFKENKYYKCYYSLIENRQNNIPDSQFYTEKHHIIPKSLGGSNQKDNLVKLLPREHFLAHWLLIKMCKNKNHEIKMKHALNRMMKNNSITEACFFFFLLSSEQVQGLLKAAHQGVESF